VVDTARAFDAVAPEYDGALGNNILIQRMRHRVIRKIIAAFPRGARLLDMGCGTGIDAVDLATRGYEIVAIDSSRGMVERTQTRIMQAGVEDRARAIHLGIHELERLREEPFDGLYSNLGPLNCVPDPRSASRDMARWLKSRGRFVASVIGKYCPWEIAFFAAQFNFQRARVRLTNNLIPVPLQSEIVWTRYYSPHEFYRAFADDFELVSFRALNVFLPPPYLAHTYIRYKTFFAPLAFLDDRLGGAPLVRNLGDHFLIELQKRK
jgi:ubiquinone/menaquinone biosynthesis C-methylase UbiE